MITIVLVTTLLRVFSASYLPHGIHTSALGLPVTLSVALACTLVFWWMDVYSPIASPLNIYETEQILRATITVAGGAALLASQGDLYLALQIFVVAIIVAVLLVTQRSLVRRLPSFRNDPVRALIYAPKLETDLLEAIDTVAGQRLEVAGLLSDTPWDLIREDEIPCRFFGRLNELNHAVNQTGASHVLVVGDATQQQRQRILQECERSKLLGSVVLDPRTLSTLRPAYTFMHDLPVMQYPAIAVRAQFLQLKRAIDLVFGSLLLLLALPIGLILAAAIRWDSRGPIFFRQQRIGKDSQPFELFKFRSMHNWSPKYHRSPTSDSDPRITRIGKLLRRFSLDELPQLINVVNGDMSLVGPRPEMPFIVDQYNEAARTRLVVRPGITGLWQISRARSLPIHHNLQYDLFYIARQSIFLDAAIMLRTVGAVFRGVGAA